MILFDPVTARQILEAYRLLEGRYLGTANRLSMGSRWNIRVAERSLGLTGDQAVELWDRLRDDGTVNAALLSYDQAAEVLNVSRSTVKRFAADGELPVVRFGKSTRVRPADLDAFIQSRCVRGAVAQPPSHVASTADHRPTTEETS